MAKVERFTFNDLEKYMLEYLTAKLPDVPKDTVMEIATTMAYKFALAHSDGIAERDRIWKRDIQRAYRRTPPEQ